MQEQQISHMEKSWQRGKDFLGTEYAILGGAMSWVSEANLVSAISNAGGFGVLATGSLSLEMIKKEIHSIRQKTEKNFGVNLVTMRPDMDELIDLCIMEKIDYVVLAAGIPEKKHLQKMKDAQMKIMCFASSLALAKRLIRNGVDALIIEGSEAGGHIGPVSTSVLMQEIIPYVKDVPIFVAGGIGTGQMMVNALCAGASGVQLGTILVCAEESVAHEKFKKAFIRANSRDALPTIQLDPDFPVIPVRSLKNEATEEFMRLQMNTIDSYKKGELSKEEAILTIEHFWAGSLKRAVMDGDVEQGSLMAGQIVGVVKSIEPVSDIFNRLLNEAKQYIKGEA